MRIVIATAALAGAAIASAAVALTPHRAHAQTIDRYGGTSTAYAPLQYAPLQYAPAPAAPSPYAQPAYAQAHYAPAQYAPAQYAPAPYAQPPYPATSSAPPSAASAGLRTLTWPGKTGEAPQQAYAPPAVYAPVSYPTQSGPPIRFAPPPTAYAPTAAYAPNPGAVLPQSGGVAPRPTVLRPVPVQAVSPTTYSPAAPRSAAPTSIYSDAPAAIPTAGVAPYGPYVSAQAQAAARAAAPQPETPGPQARARPAQMTAGQPMSANAADLSPAERAALLPPPSNDSRSRLYSVHREYGMTPDAAPIPPAFFTATADLTTPETPDVAPRNTSTASKAAQNAARLAAAAGQ